MTPILPTSTEPTTTAEEQRITAGQRKINLVWEYTQSIIALLITLAVLNICLILVFKGQNESALQLISNAFFLIVGFYFGRTNHQRTGGISKEEYDGR